jgi:hypothetical protein
MRTTFDPQGLTWLAAQLRWERLLDDLRRATDEPSAPLGALERPWAA